MVAVDDVVRTHVLQVNPLLLEELKGLVHVLQAVDTHAAFSWFGLRGGESERQGGRERVKGGRGGEEEREEEQDKWTVNGKDESGKEIRRD